MESQAGQNLLGLLFLHSECAVLSSAPSRTLVDLAGCLLSPWDEPGFFLPLRLSAPGGAFFPQPLFLPVISELPRYSRIF